MVARGKQRDAYHDRTVDRAAARILHVSRGERTSRVRAEGARASQTGKARAGRKEMSETDKGTSRLGGGLERGEGRFIGSLPKRKEPDLDVSEVGSLLDVRCLGGGVQT